MSDQKEKTEKQKPEPLKVRRPDIRDFMKLRDRLSRRAKWSDWNRFNWEIIHGGDTNGG
jgi:hypothetical protein